MKTVLITGGCGFIGFNMMSRLLRDNTVYKIVLVDNFITSNKTKIQLFLQRYIGNCVIEMIEGDICSLNVIQEIKDKNISINEIYHLASLASPPFYKKFPMETLDVGYIGTKNVLNLTVHYKCKMLYTSTSEIYGDALEHPQKETYYGNVNTVGDRSSYDESKRIGETLVYTYTKQFDLDTRIVRIFNTYGPHMSIGDGRIITEIMRSMLLGKTLTIFGDGNQTRSLCFVDDTVEMLVAVMNETYKQPINVGNNQEVTINHLVDICIDVYSDYFKKKPNVNIMYTSIDKDDPKVRNPCLKLNTHLLGSIPRTDLRDGLLKTLQHFENVIEGMW